MNNSETIEFFKGLKDGDFVTVEIPIFACPTPKIYIACYAGMLEEDGFGYMWHKASCYFALGFEGEFKIHKSFGVCTRAGNDVFRKSTISEIMRVKDAMRRSGYQFNRRTKELKYNPSFPFKLF